MKRSDLFRRYADVVDMCEGTKVKPFVKLDGEITQYPNFDSEGDYKFPLEIVEDKLVFDGDILYDGLESVMIIKMESDGHILCRAIKDFYLSSLETLTWTKPDEFAHILKAQSEGKRIVFFDGAKWVDTDVIDTVNFKPESYKVAEHDMSHTKYETAFNNKIRVRYRKCGITGKISAEVIE